MRIEPASTAPPVSFWGAIVCAYLSLVGLHMLIGSHRGADSQPLCLFRVLTGRPCPTCGATRMVMAVARGDLQGAVACNPLMFAAGVVALGLWALRIGFRRRIIWITSARSREILTVALVMAVLVNWAYLLRVF